MDYNSNVIKRCVEMITHYKLDKFCILLDDMDDLPYTTDEICKGLTHPFHPLRQLFTDGQISRVCISGTGAQRYTNWIYVYLRLLKSKLEPATFYAYMDAMVNNLSAYAPPSCHDWFIARVNRQFPST
jgi:hypothetical protein